MTQVQTTQSPQDQVNDSAAISRAATALLEKLKASKLQPRLAWENELRNRRVAARVLAEALYQLHRKGEYEQVIEGIEASLRNNKGQPWMYMALVQEMKVAGRPQAEVDRALLSRIDFTTNNEAQLLVAAAMMGKFDAHEQAVDLCREAIKRNPWQPTTWGLARRLAKSSKSVDDLIWAYTGTLKHVWHDDYKLLHDEVKTEMKQLESDLQQSGNLQMASAVQDALREATIQDIRVRLMWAGDADLDLSIIEPGGAECSYRQRITSNSGMLITDSDGGEAKGGRHTEEYLCVEAKPGNYTIKVNYISGRVISGQALLQVIRHANTPQEQKQTVRIDIGARNASIPLPLKSGRAGKQAR